MIEPKTLEEVRAELALLAEKREARALRSAAEQLADAKRELADAEAIERAELEHGRVGEKIKCYPTSLGVVIVKRPHHLFWKKFQAAGKVDEDTLGPLVKKCLVHPDPATYESLIEELPGVVMGVGNLVIELSGLRVQDVAGK